MCVYLCAFVDVCVYVCVYVYLCCLLEFYILATSNQDGYRLVTGCTHGDFIVLPQWKTMSTAQWPDFLPQLHYPYTELTSPWPILVMSSTPPFKHLNCMPSALETCALLVFCAAVCRFYPSRAKAITQKVNTY